MFESLRFWKRRPAVETSPLAGVLKIRLGVARDGATVQLVVIVNDADEATAPRVPLTGHDARELAALLYGAAASADPAGHQAMIDAGARSLAEEVTLATLPVQGTH